MQASRCRHEYSRLPMDLKVKDELNFNKWSTFRSRWLVNDINLDGYGVVAVDIGGLDSVGSTVFAFSSANVQFAVVVLLLDFDTSSGTEFRTVGFEPGDFRFRFA